MNELIDFSEELEVMMKGYGYVFDISHRVAVSRLYDSLVKILDERKLSQTVANMLSIVKGGLRQGLPTTDEALDGVFGYIENTNGSEQKTQTKMNYFQLQGMLTVSESINYLGLKCNERTFTLKYLYGKDPKIKSYGRGIKYIKTTDLDAYIESKLVNQ